MSLAKGSVAPDQSFINDYRKPSTTLLAAAGVSFGPGTNARWKLYHFRIKLVTSSTVGNRTILVYMTDGTTAPVAGTQGANVITEWVNNGTTPGVGRTVAASTTEYYEATVLKGADASITVFRAMAEPLRIGKGYTLFIQDTAQIDPANDKVTIETLVEEWIELT